MKTIRDWNDMQQFGIRTLTGEACVVGLRLLCDLTAKGVDLIRHIFRMPNTDWSLEHNIRALDLIGVQELLGDTKERLLKRVRQFAENCNSGDKDDPAVASIMLPRCLFKDLAIMGCLANGCETAVVREDGTVMGFTESELAEHLPRVRKYHPNAQFYGKLPGQQAVGLNAVPVM